MFQQNDSDIIWLRKVETLSDDGAVESLKRYVFKLKIFFDTFSAIEFIKRELRVFSENLKIKKKIIINNIINSRLRSAVYLQTFLRSFKIHKQVQKILKKLQNNFCIVSMIKGVKKMILKIYLNKNKTQELDFEYCPIRETYVLYLPKDILMSKNFIKVNFIADGKIFIDSHYKTDYEDSSFYNIIELKKFLEIEKEKAEHMRTILLCLRFKQITPRGSSSDDDDLDTSDARGEDFKNNFKRPNYKKRMRNSISYETTELLKKLKSNTDMHLPKVNTCTDLKMIKPILKSPSTSGLNLKSNATPKKVSFTNILTSYDYY
jgi:hypothetical protein